MLEIEHLIALPNGQCKHIKARLEGVRFFFQIYICAFDDFVAFPLRDRHLRGKKRVWRTGFYLCKHEKTVFLRDDINFTVACMKVPVKDFIALPG